ncbi:MAG: hypothetical protein IH881_19085 [Myxococcales bacterium]|nr:hypothetical protein [Myxococcales bacterium]
MLAIFSESAGKNARGIVQIVHHVPLAYIPNSWNRYELNVTRDAVRGFPEHRGEDNSMRQVSIGVESRRRKHARVLFDDFRIEQSLAGARAFEANGRLIDEVAQAYPEIVQLQGLEVSYFGPHINIFSQTTEIPDYDRLMTESGISLEGISDADSKRIGHAVTAQVIDAVHRSGGLVSVNHRLGSEPGRVDFFEMTGSWSFEDGVLTLDDLKGNGWLEIETIAE